MNGINKLSYKDRVTVQLITANANFMRDEIMSGKESKEEKDEMIDKLREETKKILINILFEKNE